MGRVSFCTEMGTQHHTKTNRTTESEKRTVGEMARLKQDSFGELDAEASRVSDQLRRQAAQLAIEQALASLPGKLDASTQARLIDQSIQSLGNG